MKKLLPLFMCLFLQLSAQQTLQPVKQIASEQRGMSSATYAVSDELLPETDYSFVIATEQSFSCFGIGWHSNEIADPETFRIQYRTMKRNGTWTSWTAVTADFSPSETPTGLYWTDALFTQDATSHDFLEVRFNNRLRTDAMRIDLFDGNGDGVSITGPYEGHNAAPSRACPQFPAIITRSTWCGGTAPCSSVNASYTTTTITPTHVMIHHGASPDTYTDGAAVVRSYWNYHVNTLGWSDIGYNYLIDKFGNLYQGRHNPSMPNVDVRGAHAGNSNSKSIGVNFLGNADVTIATTLQLNKLYALLGWWFDFRGFDPATSASIPLQVSGSATKPRILGHRDVNSTTCPGNDLYSRLPNIRLQTQAVIDACSTPPSSVVSTDYDWRGHDFWVKYQDEASSGESGVVEQYEQVLEYNGTEWRGNATHGFFNDNFNSSIHSSWTANSGTWAISSGTLSQSDNANGNSNIYTPLTQNNTKSYMYHWKMNINGTGTARRGGLHFFISNPSLPNRGNSYLAWFRPDDGRFEFYRVDGDVLYRVVNNTVTINANTWLDCKVTYNPQTGVVQAFMDNVLIATYTDPSPLQSGQYISLRNGSAKTQFEDLKVRTSRLLSAEAKVTVGTASQKHARYQSPSKTQDACRINTMVKDSANNWSDAAVKNIYIDWTSPTTTVPTISGVKSTDFSVSFTDNDNVNGSGVDRRFYAVSDFNSTEWRANTNNGFAVDSFNTSIHSDWTLQTGTWAIASGTLRQNNEAIDNSNIYSPLNQTLSNRYMYSFRMNIGGTGTNRRAGFHYFINQPHLDNRGDSYFIWFRPDASALEFYKTTSNVFSRRKIVPFSMSADTWYTVDVVYDRITGEHLVYVDKKLIGEWKDSAPLSTGQYVSFRNGNSRMLIDDFRAFRTRTSSVTVTVGTGNDIRYENSISPTGKVASVIIDTAQNISSVSQRDVLVKWSTLLNDFQASRQTKSSVRVYPNPGDGNFTLAFTSDTESEAFLYVFDQMGKLVHSEKTLTAVGENAIFVQLEQTLASGIYRLQFLHNDKQELINLVKK